MDSILQYTSVSHAGSLLAGINKMRVNADLCDVTVIVGDYRILAHKIILSASSPFFHQMLGIDSKSERRSAAPNCREISLDSVDEIAALKIIEFCYTSAISLDDNTVWQLLEAAIKFQFSEICSLCCEFLTAGLDVSNCIRSLRFAARLRFLQLEENCIRFLVENVQKASKSHDLVTLSPQELSSVLSILEIHETPVQVMTTLAQSWLNWDGKSREGFVPKLKLLLPFLSEFFHNYRCGAGFISDLVSATPADPKAARVDKETEEGLPDVVSRTASKSQTSSFSRSPSSEKRTATASGENIPADDSVVFLNASRQTDGADVTPKSLSYNGGGHDETCCVNGKDFICVSCGDEFECHEDLAAHGHLCHESARLVKKIDGGDGKNSRSTNLLLLKQNPQDPLMSQDNNNDEKINRVESSTGDIVEDMQQESSEEPSSYPKTRRSLRNRNLDIKIDGADIIGTSAACNGGGDSPSSLQESGLGNSIAEDIISTEIDVGHTVSVTEEEGRSKEDGGLESDEAKMHAGAGSRDDCSIVAQGEVGGQSSSTGINDDDNVNHSLSANSVTVDGDETASVAASTSKSITESKNQNEDIGKDNEVSSRWEDKASEDKGSSTLRQWRQEYQNSSSPVNSFIQSSPKHKCLICSRGFWDRKALSNHWRQNHGVRSMANDNEEENSCSDHETEPHRRSYSPKQACLQLQPQNGPSSGGIFESAGAAYDARGERIHAESFMHGGQTFDSTSNSSSHIPNQSGVPHTLGLPKVKDEIVDARMDSNALESVVNYQNFNDKSHPSPPTAIEVVHDQTNGKPSSFEMSNDASLMRGALWSQENTESPSRGTDAISLAKASQNINPATSEFFANYINQYNKLAEWCIAQGTPFCPVCMGYHPLGKQCPKAAGQASANSKVGSKDGSSNSKGGELGPSTTSKENKKAKNAKAAKREAEEEGPLDMSKSSVEFSPFGQMTPSNSGGSSKSSSSINSSGHSSVLGASSFFNYSHLMSDSDALDMSTPRFGDGKGGATPHQIGGDLAAMSLKKSPLDPNMPYGSPFPAFIPQFSTVPSSSLLPPSSGGPPSSADGNPSTSTPVPTLPKSSNAPRKKISSRQGFPCTVCNRVFAYQTALFTHMHTHSPSARSYRCQLCNESFARAPDLKVHVCPNGNEKPYSCPSCGQTFAKNIHLKRHLATHSGLKPYPCWVCGKRFSRSDHLKRHTQSIHAGARPHVCQVCGKEFVRKYELNKHVQTHEQPAFAVVS